MNLNPKEDAKKALDIIENGYNFAEGFATHNPVWYFTTENLNELFNNFNFEGKDVLTICSSGDHAINAILRGAKKIDCFDINVLTAYYTSLKIAAIRQLSYEKFISSFIERNLNIDVYKRIRRNLDQDVEDFWDIMFKNIIWKENILDTDLFIRQSSKKDVCINNTYLKKDKYYELKDKLKNANISNISYITSSLTDLPKNTTNLYDLMFLSNLNDHADKMFKKDFATKYKNFITMDLANCGKEDAKIVAAYLYSHKTNNHFIECFKDIADIVSFTYFFNEAYKGRFDYYQNLKDRAIIYKK